MTSRNDWLRNALILAVTAIVFSLGFRLTHAADTPASLQPGFEERIKPFLNKNCLFKLLISMLSSSVTVTCPPWLLKPINANILMN